MKKQSLLLLIFGVGAVGITLICFMSARLTFEEQFQESLSRVDHFLLKEKFASKRGEHQKADHFDLEAEKELAYMNGLRDCQFGHRKGE